MGVYIIFRLACFFLIIFYVFIFFEYIHEARFVLLLRSILILLMASFK